LQNRRKCLKCAFLGEFRLRLKSRDSCKSSDKERVLSKIKNSSHLEFTTLIIAIVLIISNKNINNFGQRAHVFTRKYCNIEGSVKFSPSRESVVTPEIVADDHSAAFDGDEESTLTPPTPQPEHQQLLPPAMEDHFAAPGSIRCRLLMI